MPVVHSAANGQFVKGGAGPGAKKQLAKPTTAQAANISKGLDPNAKPKKAKAAKKGRAKSSKGSASAAKKAPSAASVARTKAAAARKAAAKSKFAASQHKKAVHKAVMAKRAVLALEKKANAPGASADAKLRATQARRTFTNANAAYDKQKSAAKSAQAAFNTRHHKGSVKVAAKGSGKVLGTGSVGGLASKAAKTAVSHKTTSTIHKSPVHKAAHHTKSAPKVRGFSSRRGF